MTRRTWLVFWVCIGFMLLAILALTWCGSGSQIPGSAPKSSPVAQLESEPAHRVRRTSREPQGDDPAPPNAPTSMELRLVDVATGLPIANATLRLAPAAQPVATTVATTSSLGVVACPAVRPIRVSAETSGLELIFPDKQYDAPAEDILACRAAVIACDVELSDSPAERPPIRVLATPSHRAQGEFVSDAKRIGSPEWLRVNGPSLSVVSVTSTANPIMLRTPIFPEVTFLASAEGYLADVTAVRFDSADPASVKVKMTLRRARHVAIEVTDEDGSPVAGATFQYAVQRRGGIGLVNPAVLYPLREVIRCGFTATTSDQTQTSVLNAIVNARGDANGLATVAEPLQGDRDYLIVWAEGFEPHVQRRDRPSPVDETIAVRLRRRVATCDTYRLMRRGGPLGGVALMLAEKVDDEFTPSLPVISVAGDGRFPSGLIVPGRRYLATVMDGRSKHTYRGELTFGTTSDVDADNLVE